MNFNLGIFICLVVLTLAVVFVAVYLIISLIQIKKTAREIECAFEKINTELEIVNKVSDKVANISEKLSSPLISIGSILFYILSGIKPRRKNKCKEEENV